MLSTVTTKPEKNCKTHEHLEVFLRAIHNSGIISKLQLGMQESRDALSITKEKCFT